jgi:hypothetical protein
MGTTNNQVTSLQRESTTTDAEIATKTGKISNDRKFSKKAASGTHKTAKKMMSSASELSRQSEGLLNQLKEYLQTTRAA